MTKINGVIRDYRVTDAEMLQASDIFHTLFQHDTLEFVGFVADFDTSFVENWTIAISSAELAKPVKIV